MEGPFFKTLLWQMGDNLLGGCSTWRTNIRSCQRWGSFTNTLFSNHFSFFQSWRYIHLKIKPWPKLWKYLYLKLMIKRFQRLCHVQLDLDIFVKFTLQIGIALEKQWWSGNGSHYGEVVILMGKGWVGFHCVILLYWNFIVLLGTVKEFIGYLFSLYFCCFAYFVSIQFGKGKRAS